MKNAAEAFRLLEESNPVAEDAFTGAADDSLSRATFERIIASPARPARARLHSLGERRLISLAAVAAGAAIVAGLLPGLLSGPQRVSAAQHPSSRHHSESPWPPGTVHSAWEPARPLPLGAVKGLGGHTKGWRLASYLVSAGWRENTAGPEPGLLTCPTALTCYVQGDNSTSDSGPADMDTMYVTYDGATSWNALPVPAGVRFTSALSCGSVGNCAAGAVYHGRPALATTADGAHSWIIDPLPPGDGQIFQLNCPAATTCTGLVSPTPPLNYAWYVGVKFLAITDGGRHFATFAFPDGTLIQGMTCPTSTDCVALGPGSIRTMTQGVVLTTRDGAAHWSHGTLPADLEVAPFPPLTCVDASHCFMIGDLPESNGLEVTAMAVTADGGRTWTERRFPASVPDPVIDAIACPTAMTCYGSGQEAVPQQVGTGVNEDSPVVVITRDGGQTWSRVTFAVPAGVTGRGAQAEEFLSIGQIQCPRLNMCIALGSAAQGSKSTAVYTSFGAP